MRDCFCLPVSLRLLSVLYCLERYLSFRARQSDRNGDRETEGDVGDESLLRWPQSLWLSHAEAWSPEGLPGVPCGRQGAK